MKKIFLTLFILIPSLSWGEVINTDYYQDWKYQEYQDVITDKIDSSISTYDSKNNKRTELILWGGGSKSTSFIKSIDLTDVSSLLCSNGSLINTIIRVDKNTPMEKIFYLSKHNIISKKIDKDDQNLINQFITGNEVVLRISDDKCVMKSDYFFSLNGFGNSIKEISSMYFDDWYANITKCIKVQNAEIRYYDFNVIQFEMINECSNIYNEGLTVKIKGNNKTLDSYDLDELQLLPTKTYVLSTDFKADLIFNENSKLEIVYGGVELNTKSKVLK